MSLFDIKFVKLTFLKPDRVLKEPKQICLPWTDTQLVWKSVHTMEDYKCKKDSDKKKSNDDSTTLMLKKTDSEI